MTYLSIIEKLRILYDMLVDFKVVSVFLILILLATIVYGFKKMSNKNYIIFVTISFLAMFGISIFSNYKTLSNTFDNFATLFFRNIYFPSIYVYIGVWVVSFVMFIISIFNVMTKKVYKIINTSMFVINNLLFVIILNIIAKNKIDIFSMNSLYTNTNLVAILEISMGVCVLWCISLIITYITNTVCDRLSYRKSHSLAKAYNQELVINNTEDYKNILDVNVNTDESLENSMIGTDMTNNLTPIEAIGSEEMQNDILETISVDVPAHNIENTEVNEQLSFNDILNNIAPVTYYDNNVDTAQYNLVNPQQIYEEKYYNAKLDSREQITEISNNIGNQEEIIEINDNVDNNISLNDLIEESQIEIEEPVTKVQSGYTQEDYRKALEMLNTLKSYSHGSDVNIDDAIAISLISNYSIDDCLKFKKILESNLN